MNTAAEIPTSRTPVYSGGTVKRIPQNERPDIKRHRLTVAIVREFVKEFPDEAAKIVRELLPNSVK